VIDIVEIYWNARPHLDRMGVKVNSNALDPRAERMFSEVRGSVADAFPGSVTLLRIAVRSRKGEDDIRIVRRSNSAEPAGDIPAIRARIESAVERAMAPPS
jgi:hypothetical protein